MQARNAAKVFPDPVGAEINVVSQARMCGQPCSCGSVGVPNFAVNHSATSGWAQESGDIRIFYSEDAGFANCSLLPDCLAFTAKYSSYSCYPVSTMQNIFTTLSSKGQV